jgi:phage I-like protein
MNKIYTFTPTDSHLRQLSGSKTIFKKQLIRFGEWIDPIYPEDVMRIDRVFLETIVKNFKAGIPGRIPVPLTHTDNPEYNTGEVVELTIEGDGANVEDGLYGLLEIRREDTAEDIRNELIFDVSISFSPNYTDNENGALYGPTLLHTALVNNPYIKKMGGFTSLAEDLQKIFGEKMEVRSLSENAISKEITMTKVKNDREFAVEVVHTVDGKEVKNVLEPEQELELSEDQLEAVTKQLSEAVAPEADGDEGDAGDDAGDDQGEGEGDETNLSETEKELRDARRRASEAEAKLRAADIDSTYQTALSEGKIVPAQEEAFRALAEAVHGQTRNLSDGETQNLSEVLADFIAKAPKVVSLDEENGKNADDTDKGPFASLSEESKQGLAKAGVSEADYVKYGARESVSINELRIKEN